MSNTQDPPQADHNIGPDTDVPVPVQAKAEPDNSTNSTKILEHLGDLQKQIRSNENDIRLLERAKQAKLRDLNRELRKRQIKINKIIIKQNNSDTDVSNDLPLLTVRSLEDLKSKSSTALHAPHVDSQLSLMTQVAVYNEEADALQIDIDNLKEVAFNDLETLEFEIQEKKIQNIELTKLMRNSWSDENDQTIMKWIQESNRQNFVYERVLGILQTKFNRLTLAATILTGIQSLLTVSNIGLNETDYKTLNLVFKIIVAVFSIVSFILLAYVKQFDIGLAIQTYTSYTERLDSFLSNLVSTIDVRPELRPDANKFITDNRIEYAAIYKDSPPIDNSYLQRGLNDYKTYVLANSEKQLYCSRKRANYASFVQDHRLAAESTDVMTSDTSVTTETDVRNARPNKTKNRKIINSEQD